MKTYEELLSDIEDDIELMGASHIVYSMEENNIITDYDYLPSDSCNISTTLKDLQENNDYWDQYEGKVAEVSNQVNDTYLKINDQKDGVQSYGRVVDLMLAMFLKNRQKVQ